STTARRTHGQDCTDRGYRRFPVLSARGTTIPVEFQRGDLAQPRPTAWVKKVPILTLSPERAKYEVRIQSQTYRTSNSIPWLFSNCRIYLSRPFRACRLEGIWTQAVGLG